MQKRGSGILLHITSLPSPFGIGDLGPDAYRFVDFLSETKQHFWQILPLTTTDLLYGNSPYGSISAYAGNPLLVSPSLMVRDGLLTEEDIFPLTDFTKNKVNYEKVTNYKEKLFDLAYERFKMRTDFEFQDFCKENSQWLEDYALFVALKGYLNKGIWSMWRPEIRDREEETLKTLKKLLHDKIEKEKFIQYLFFKQWLSLKRYCNQRDITVIGDVPIYVNYDSVDLWSNPGIFKLNDKKQPYVVAGVPPDYFSETGQLWGNPVYDWGRLKDRGYDWWIHRIEHNLRLFDLIRIDHFRGFVAYWEVRAGEKTAINGRWAKAPAEDFFGKLKERFAPLPIIAEDLGLITPDVREVMDTFGLPGMRVLLFAFGEDNPENPYLPHNVVPNCVFYTGTHDNNTIKGWFEREARDEDKKRLFSYIGREISLEGINWEMIKLVMRSDANTAIFPMQDVLGLGEDARMNRPATSKGNWLWRYSSDEITPSIKERLKEMTEIYGRA